MYAARDLSDASLSQIGQALGGRDHSTVMHGCTKIADQLTNDTALSADFEAICAALAGAPTPNAASVPAFMRR